MHMSMSVCVGPLDVGQVFSSPVQLINWSCTESQSQQFVAHPHSIRAYKILRFISVFFAFSPRVLNCFTSLFVWWFCFHFVEF